MTTKRAHRVGPWDLAALQETPPFERRRVGIVRDGAGRSILDEVYFQVQPFLGRPARACGYLAIPDAATEKLPAMLLIHGGGGMARPHWARYWAARGYAALAIDLYGQGPNRQRLPDGGCDW